MLPSPWCGHCREVGGNLPFPRAWIQERRDGGRGRGELSQLIHPFSGTQRGDAGLYPSCPAASSLGPGREVMVSALAGAIIQFLLAVASVSSSCKSLTPPVH